MVIWCIIILLVGLWGILQEVGVMTNMGDAYRISTWIALLTALGLLVRIRYKEKTGEKERMRAEINKLREEVEALKKRIAELERGRS